MRAPEWIGCGAERENLTTEKTEDTEVMPRVGENGFRAETRVETEAMI